MVPTLTTFTVSLCEFYFRRHQEIQDWLQMSVIPSITVIDKNEDGSDITQVLWSVSQLNMCLVLLV